MLFMTEMPDSRGKEKYRQAGSGNRRGQHLAHAFLNSVEGKSRETGDTDERHVRIQLKPMIHQKDIRTQSHISDEHEEYRAPACPDGEKLAEQGSVGGT